MKCKILTIASMALCAAPALTQTWVEKASLPITAQPRHHPVTFTIDGIGYLGTGGASNGAGLSDFYKYNPAANSWTKLNTFPGPARSYSYAVISGGKGYMGFGIGNNGALNDLWEYDPATDQWTEKAPCPCDGRGHPAFLEVNGKIYVGLGNNSNGNTNDFWEYTIATDTWVKKSDFPSHKRHHPYYFSLNDIVYVGFGHGTEVVNGWVVYKDFYRYEPSKDKWTKLNDFPGEARVAGTQFSFNGKGYILHGEGEDHNLLDEGEFWEYDPDFDFWAPLTSMPGGSRWAPGTFVIGNTVYSACGSVTAAYTNERDLWAYPFPVSATRPEAGAGRLHLFPNPAGSKIFVESLHAASPSEYRYEVFSASGVSVLNGRSDQNGIDLGSLPAGAYWVRVQTSEGVGVGKFLKE